jgi:adenine/guanine phosphoribosyltransferase-like PRPP-binding protein
MKKKLTIQTNYLHKVYRTDQFVKTVKLAATRIRKFRRKVKFEAIAFTGSSGAALAYPISFLLGIPLICVRKNAKDNHSGLKLEGAVSAASYIIVDDFIESGKTINKINRTIRLRNDKSNCVGIYLYNDGAINPPSFKGITVF